MDFTGSLIIEFEDAGQYTDRLPAYLTFTSDNFVVGLKEIYLPSEWQNLRQTNYIALQVNNNKIYGKIEAGFYTKESILNEINSILTRWRNSPVEKLQLDGNQFVYEVDDESNQLHFTPELASFLGFNKICTYKNDEMILLPDSSGGSPLTIISNPDHQGEQLENNQSNVLLPSQEGKTSVESPAREGGTRVLTPAEGASEKTGEGQTRLNQDGAEHPTVGTSEKTQERVEVAIPNEGTSEVAVPTVGTSGKTQEVDIPTEGTSEKTREGQTKVEGSNQQGETKEKSEQEENIVILPMGGTSKRSSLERKGGNEELSRMKRQKRIRVSSNFNAQPIAVKDLYLVHCDIIKHQLMGSNFVQIIKILSPEEGKSKIIPYISERPIYYPLYCNTFNQIGVRVTDTSGVEIPFKGKVFIVLDFKRVNNV